MAAATNREDPFLAFNFRVEANSELLGGFNEVSGLDFENELEKFFEGGVNGHEQQVAGPTKFPSRLVFKRGMTNTTKLWSWYHDVLQGKITRKTVAVRLLDSQGKEQRSWTFSEAVPVKWSGPQFRANSPDVAIETLEVVHRGLAPS